MGEFFSENGQNGEVEFSYYQQELEKIQQALLDIYDDIVSSEEDIMFAQYNVDIARDRYKKLLARKVSLPKEVSDALVRLRAELDLELEEVNWLLKQYSADEDSAQEKRRELLFLKDRLHACETYLIEQDQEMDVILNTLPINAPKN